MIDSKTIIITDEDGNEKEMEILFTFDHETSNKSYVLFTDANEDAGEVFACSYDDDGNLVAVEDENEFKMVEEVFNTYLEEFTDEE